MGELTLAPEGSGSLAKLQLLHELLHLRSGWTQDCRMSENNNPTETAEHQTTKIKSSKKCSCMMLKQQYMSKNQISYL